MFINAFVIHYKQFMNDNTVNHSFNKTKYVFKSEYNCWQMLYIIEHVLTYALKYIIVFCQMFI